MTNTFLNSVSTSVFEGFFKPTFGTILALTAGLGVLGPVSASAAAETSPQSSSAPQPSPELRQTMASHHKKMAEMHTKMAACLLSDTAFTECQREMVESCRSLAGGRCPFGTGRAQGGFHRGAHGMMGNPDSFDWMMPPE